MISIIPNFLNYPNSSVNIDYADCHWSTNYGYFVTIKSKSSFIEKQSSDFIIRKCIQNQDETVFWTYDLADYGRNKTPVIISLQVENSNKKLLNEKLGHTVDYVIGGTYSNFSWMKQDTIVISNKSIF